MLQITLQSKNSQLVVDSRLIAQGIEVDHSNLMETIATHKPRLEKRYGIIPLVTEKIKAGKGAPNKFYWLNEQVATAVILISKNTDRALEFKLDLTDAFYSQRQELLTSSYAGQLMEATDKWVEEDEAITKLVDFLELAKQLERDRQVLLELEDKVTEQKKKIEEQTKQLQPLLSLMSSSSISLQ